MNPPERDYSVFELSTHASVTKTITAVALLSLIEQKNLKITEPIADHLPDSWSPGPNVDTITVAELLSHTSGIRGGAKTYEDLEELVADGVKLADKTESSYSNANYNLARIVVAHLKGGINGQSDQAEATSKAFIAHVQKTVFDKLGIPGVLWNAEGQGTRFYPTPLGGSTGTTYGDSTLTPGSTGVRVSLAELSMFVEPGRDGRSVVCRYAQRNGRPGARLGEDDRRRRGFLSPQARLSPRRPERRRRTEHGNLQVQQRGTGGIAAQRCGRRQRRKSVRRRLDVIT
jgi:CubicO group peptidase (beta-lactamase class C family)